VSTRPFVAMLTKMVVLKLGVLVLLWGRPV